MSKLTERIRERLSQVGLSASAASQAAGLGKDFIRDLLRGKKAHISTDAARSLARVLKCNVDWLLASENGESDERPVGDGVRFGGIVEAGAFRPWDGLNQEAELRMVPLAPDPRYPITAQAAFEVMGDSMDIAKMFPGMYLLAVDIHAWEKIHGEPRDGQFVIVARTRNGEPDRELTVKRLRLFRDRIELVPESSNSRHKPLVFPNPPRPEGETEAQIVAIVVSAHWLYI